MILRNRAGGNLSRLKLGSLNLERSRLHFSPNVLLNLGSGDGSRVERLLLINVFGLLHKSLFFSSLVIGLVHLFDFCANPRVISFFLEGPALFFSLVSDFTLFNLVFEEGLLQRHSFCSVLVFKLSYSNGGRRGGLVLTLPFGLRYMRIDLGVSLARCCNLAVLVNGHLAVSESHKGLT